jgi:hypothetical protein
VHNGADDSDEEEVIVTTQQRYGATKRCAGNMLTKVDSNTSCRQTCNVNCAAVHEICGTLLSHFPVEVSVRLSQGLNIIPFSCSWRCWVHSVLLTCCTSNEDCTGNKDRKTSGERSAKE